MTSKSPGFKLLGRPDEDCYTLRRVAPDLSIQQIKGATLDELLGLKSILDHVFARHDKEIKNGN